MDSTSRNSVSASQEQSAAERDALRTRVQTLEAELVNLRAKASEATVRARRASYDASAAQMQANTAEQQLRDVLSSTSWRVTAPMRSVARVLGSAYRFARNPSWSILKRRGVSVLREAAHRSPFARKVAYWVRDRHPRAWARMSRIVIPRFAEAQAMSVTRWREGSVSRRNYAELIAARVPHYDRSVIDNFLDARVSGVDVRKLGARLAEICEATVQTRNEAARTR